jgi:spermidine synthase
MAEWYEEAYHPHWRQRFQVARYVYRGRTEFQEVVIFESPLFGRVLVLDGIVQTTERDEIIYHEMITHVALMAHGAVRDVLIIGGGDGGTLEEVLKHPALAEYRSLCDVVVNLTDSTGRECRKRVAYSPPRSKFGPMRPFWDSSSRTNWFSW